VFADGGVDGGAQGTAVLSRRGGAAPGIAGAGDAQSTVSSGGNFTAHRLPGARCEESGDLAFCGRVLLVSGSGNGGGRMDRLLCSRLERAGRRWLDDAGVLLVGFDGGAGAGNRGFCVTLPSAAFLRAGCAAGAAGIGLMLWAPSCWA